LGNTFARLPVNTIAYRFNLFSAVAVAIASSFVTAITTQWKKETCHKPSAAGDNSPKAFDNQLPFTGAWPLATGLSLALSPLVWSQAVITEVYGLNLAFVAALLWALLTRRPSWLSGLLLGLSLTTHLTSLLLLPLALTLTPRQAWLQLGAGFLLGLTPFLLLPYLAQGNSPVVWGAPTTPGSWWQHVSGRLYHSNVFALPPADLWPRLKQWTWVLLNQFTLLGLPLMIVGFFQLHPSNMSPLRQARYWLLATAILYATYAVGYRSADAIVFLLPGVLLLSLLLAPGLQRLGGAALFLPLVSLLLNFSGQNLSGDKTIRPLAEQLFQSAPPAAILLTPGDPTIFTLWYFQHVEEQRPDLILVDGNLFAFDWYRQQLQRQYPALGGLERDDLMLFRQVNQKSRPLCLVSIAQPLPATWSCSEDAT
jgi:hypothetical protein